MRSLQDKPEIAELVPQGRLLGSYSTGQPGPLVLAVGAIHGNEPSGPKAIAQVTRQLEKTRPGICGAFVGLLGNVGAFERGNRFVDEDLNRCFKAERIAELSGSSPRSAEEAELKEIVETIERLRQFYDDICFIDCHSTSSETIPYISVNAHPESLSLTSRFPTHSVVGLEESIPGCFGEYCNRFDFRGFTFEAGQHNDLASVESQEAAIWLLLVFSGAIEKANIDSFAHSEQLLARSFVEGKRAFRLVAHYKISPGEGFQMLPGFLNFSVVAKGQLLARNIHGDIRSPASGRILMPLYQKQGDDGFFILEEDS